MSGTSHPVTLRCAVGRVRVRVLEQQPRSEQSMDSIEVLGLRCAPSPLPCLGRENGVEILGRELQDEREFSPDVPMTG